MPSANANCSARGWILHTINNLLLIINIMTYTGLALIGAAMANKGKYKDIRVLSQQGWDAMHNRVSNKKMFE